MGKGSALAILGCILMTSCQVNYSFTGADTPPDARTVTIDPFENRATLAPPNSAQVFTERLRDLISAQTPLNIAQQDGDLEYAGTITGYDVQPVAIQANETAAMNRLTITVGVVYINNKEPNKNGQFSVARFSYYDSSQDLVSVEDALLQTISDQLAQDIFDRTLGNW